MCARTNEVPLKTKFICRLFTRREPWFQTFQFASTRGGIETSMTHIFFTVLLHRELKTDRAFTTFRHFQNEKNRDVSKNFVKILSLFSLINFITNNRTQFRIIGAPSSNIWNLERKFSKEITIATYFSKFQVIVLSFLSSNFCWKITVFLFE